MRDMEIIFDAKRYPTESRLSFSKYMLIGETSHWWGSMKMLLESGGKTITQEIFKKKFYAKYFPNSVRFAKEVEFLQLVQGGKSVSEYTKRFKHLIWFHTQKINEEW